MCELIFNDKRWIILWLCIALWHLSTLSVCSMEIEDSFDYGEIQKAMEEMMPKGHALSFKDLIDQLVQGEIGDFFRNAVAWFGEALFLEIKSSRVLLVQVIGIVVLSAVFTNFSMAFTKTFIAETGFYLTYMILFTLLLTSFMSAVAIAVEIMDHMTRFMSVLLPLFCMAVMITGNMHTGIWFGQAMLAVITGIEWVLSKGVFSLVHLYVLISMVNQLSKEDMLSKCADLLKTITEWITKTGLMFVLGVHFIQGMIMPAFDTLKNGWTARLTSAIPGVGDVMESVIKTMGGSAVLIKNGVGVAGLLVLVLLFLIPACKLAVLVVFYMGAQAVIQPVADKRMLACLNSVSEGVLMLLKIEGSVCVLFFVSLAVMIAVSGNVFGG